MLNIFRISQSDSPDRGTRQNDLTVPGCPKPPRQPFSVSTSVLRPTFCLAVVSACANGIATAAPRPVVAADDAASALLDIWSEREAVVVAVAKAGQWESPSSADAELLKRLAKAGAKYHLLRSVSGEPAGTGKDQLSGSMREDCFEFYFGLAAPSAVGGFSVVSTGAPVQPVQLQTLKVQPAYKAAVAEIIKRASGLKVKPTIERAYRVDLDGNGKPEVVLQATHPDLTGDPATYKPEYHSLVVVLPDSAGTEPVYTGYLQAAKTLQHFEVLTVDSVADVDHDGNRELLVRARHAEGWQTQIFRYDRALKEVFRSVGGEGQCPSNE